MKAGTFKVLGIVVLISVLIACLALSASAVDQSQLSFKTNSDGTLVISSCDKNAEGELVIPATINGRTVVEIADNAFAHCSTIRKVTLPSTVTRIGYQAFVNCSALEEISIPSGLKEIGPYAFYECGLRAVSLPDTVTTIGNAAFQRCADLADVRLPNGLETVPYGCFRECAGLKEIRIPTSVSKIDTYAFEDTGLKSVVIPSNVTIIGPDAFNGCSDLKTVTLNEGLQRIQASAFQGCTSLKTVTIPDSVTSLQMNSFGFAFTFSDCTSLETVMIGKGVTKLDSDTFKGCTSLRTIYLHSNLQSIGYNDFNNCPALTDIYYCGTSSQWLATAMADGNDALILADVHYIESFRDVQTGSWYGPAVLWAVGQNITNGIGNNAFAPSDTCTSAQVITFLYRAAGEPSISGASALTNVQNSDVYYYKPCVWAYQKGIITDKNFKPDEPATRASFVTYIWRYAGKPSASGVTNPFTDVRSGDPACQAILWAYKNNITTGTSATTFSPDTICSRGHIVTFLYRYFS